MNAVPVEGIKRLQAGDVGGEAELAIADAQDRTIVRLGGRIHCGSHVSDFEKKPRRPQVKTSDKHAVTAGAVVFATNSPVNDWVTMHTKQSAYRTYVVAVRIPRGSVPRGLYWDNELLQQEGMRITIATP